MPQPEFRLQLRDYSFDPLEGLPALPENLRRDTTPSERAYYIIQFTKSLEPSEREYLQRRYGLHLTEYLPKFAFIEKLDAQTLKVLSTDSLYRASILFQPAFKVAADIGQHVFRTAERQALQGLSLRAVLFPEAEPAPVVAALEAWYATDIKVLDDRAIGGSAQIQFMLPDHDTLAELAALHEVRWIEEVAESIEDNVGAAETLQSGSVGNASLWDRGLRGEGQIIGILDSGPLDINHCFFQDPVDNTPSPTHRKVVALRNASGSASGGHATFVSGNAAGDDFNTSGIHPRRGGAWAARLVSGNRIDVFSGLATLLAELTAAAGAGATIHSNSWHDNTAGAGNPALYNQNAADVDTFTWINEDHLVLGSAGNVGEEQGPPGTAKNAICVGATQADPSEMNFGDGNPGPTADGRRKPDLYVPGCNIQSATNGTACATGPRSPCATSYATPHAAAAAALVRQYYTEGWYPSGIANPADGFVPSGALLKATLLNSTIDMTGILGYPGDLEGWGLVRLENGLFFYGNSRNLWIEDIRNANGLTTGDTKTHTVEVASSAETLKVTLVWTDPPGAAGAANPVINDLDLVVTSPDGTQTFFGNNFAGNVSVTGGAADSQNNVEMVLINTPMPGEWSVTVVASEVNIGNPGQGYALVVTGDLVKGICEISVPITLSIPIEVESEVIAKPSDCYLDYKSIPAEF